MRGGKRSQAALALPMDAGLTAGGAENANPSRAEVGLNPLETLKETFSADQYSVAPPITLRSLKNFQAARGDLETGANLAAC